MGFDIDILCLALNYTRSGESANLWGNLEYKVFLYFDCIFDAVLRNLFNQADEGLIQEQRLVTGCVNTNG